ncbi:MAG: hypothetical protein A2W91_07920 [Bacteroidetes bacterium GWF2_38_335]|nr:MAG: hypothetical protein A2W91_07920 [Bacteroidetes bacterium GWF2_38_335]OFY79169.1 MAG: hypothetical protein A2281_02800 [Bacteroidetes bacterium RIFOXYA12_FULL_38_20]
MDDKKLIKKCLKKDTGALEELYKQFSPKLYGICLRYTKNKMEAEDLLHDGFIRILDNLETYRGDGSFEGWLCRIMVTTAINYYRKKGTRYEDVEINNIGQEDVIENDITSMMSHNEMLDVIQQLPEGYRVVFNMYAIEGYSHKEISEMLNISENTSKTQLLKARRTLQKKIFTDKQIKYEKSA